MQFATLDDLAAIGATKLDDTPGNPVPRRAVRLIELASAQVAAYVKLADQAAFDDLAEPLQTVITAIVAEAASSRLSVSAAANVNQWPPDETTWSSALLAPRHYRALDRAFGRPGSSGSVSLPVTRDPDTSYLHPSAFPWSTEVWR